MKRRPALFRGYWFNPDGSYVLEHGRKLRVRQSELREAWRLWCRHADVRTGRVRPRA